MGQGLNAHPKGPPGQTDPTTSVVVAVVAPTVLSGQSDMGRSEEDIVTGPLSAGAGTELHTQGGI